ncbi:mechanosensitive ion channel family protein [Cohnella endophytica]|uniref:Mechanosensitive ion channel family protein n=1 Tax=Cohnella endophytica TaxID=2419778 RepID=A0A494XTA0_9BACL|nr:mechanosensitive ion channel family protein [Cohnella endophytica]RKP51319.1 mechanosensitive ion channel family protein [Cohnella endophytica]
MRSWPAIQQGFMEGNLWNKFIDQIWDTIRNTGMWEDATMVLLRVVLIIIVSRLALMALNRFVDHVTNEKKSKRLKLRTRRVQTMGKLLKNTASYIINFITILLILGEFHIQLAPLLAGAGVIGLAIGFGAQSLVKDVITGFFIILEDQFAVGDVVQLGTFKGTVEMIGLRATRLRSWTGEIHIIPNGAIVQVTNFSVNPLLAVVDLTISSDKTVEQQMAAIRKVLDRIESPYLTAKPEVLGIQTLEMNQMTIRVTARCKPNRTGEITRLINTELKKAFDTAKAVAATDVNADESGNATT